MIQVKKAKKELRYEKETIFFHCKKGNLEELKKFVENGGPVFGKFHKHEYVLYYAFKKENIDIVRYLIELGCNINEYNDEPILCMLSRKGLLGMIKILLEYFPDLSLKSPGDGSNAIHEAVFGGYPEIVDFLLKNGMRSYLNSKTNFLDTPLHIASRYGHKECAKILLSNGAFINELNSYTYTPLHCAASSGCKETVEILLSFGASPNDYLGRSDNIWDHSREMWGVFFSKGFLPKKTKWKNEGMSKQKKPFHLIYFFL